MHTATFMNWNGKTISVDFKAGTTKWVDLVKKAHAAILKAGYTTVQLLKVDGDDVEPMLAYR